MTDSPQTRPKILVIGYARHGKDTVCELLRDVYGFSFVSSSFFCAEMLIFPLLASKYNYQSVKDCFDDRVNHRAEWYEAIRAYNLGDDSRLGRAIWEKNDVYCGLRSSVEFKVLQNKRAFDYCFWVDAGNREPDEDQSSCTVEKSMADYIIDNRGSLDQLALNLDTLMQSIGIDKAGAKFD